jgi:hypothetical protein
MLIRLTAYSDLEHEDGEEGLVNMAHIVFAKRELRRGLKPHTALRMKDGTLYVHETLDQIAEKVGGCP